MQKKERQPEEGKKQTEIKNSRADDYKTVFVHQIYGGEREDHFEMVVESLGVNAGESQAKNKTILELCDEVCLKMTPEQAKRLYLWLGQHIATFEKKFREIKVSIKEADVGEGMGFHTQD